MILLFFAIRPKTDKLINPTIATLINKVIFSIVFKVSIMILIKIYRSKLGGCQALLKRLYRRPCNLFAENMKRAEYFNSKNCFICKIS